MPIQSEQVISYDPSVVPMCGGVAPALLFCWYEQIFNQAGFPPEGVTRPQIREWRTGLGYSKSCQPWYRTFYRIGVIHLGTPKYRAAVRAGREFLSEVTGSYVFYALEITRADGPATLHRNAPLIDSKIAQITGQAPAPPSVKEIPGPWVRAREDAALFRERIEKVIPQQ